MARGRAVVRGRAGARLLLRLALIVACSKGRSSTAPAATRLRPAAREAALDWSAYADPQTASQRFRVRTHEPSAAFSSRASCIDAGRRRRARGVASGGHGAGAAQGAPARSSLLSLSRRPSLAVSGCAGALAQEEVFIVGRGSPSLVGTVGTWCGALRAPSAGAGFCSGGRSSVSATPRRYRPIRDQRIANFVARGAGSSADAAASRDPQFDLVLRVPKSAGAEMWQRAVGLWPGQHGARHAYSSCAVPEPRSLTRRCWLARSPRGRRSGSGSVAGAHRRAASLLVERGAPACKIVACETGTAASCRGGAHSRRRAGECAQA